MSIFYGVRTVTVNSKIKNKNSDNEYKKRTGGKKTMALKRLKNVVLALEKNITDKYRYSQ